MASFTDQTPQFNPYVQQLPVEAMVKVGMEKQQRYDEGVQKIQTNIDNIAGLDIVKDSDKQYLQSKLNALGNNLKTVAAGDFSNYQLVNSVGGMAKQIGTDKNIQNAVGSTAWYRKQRARIEKDVEDGVSNPANLDDFDKKASSWINSDKVGEKFNGEYSKYFDVDKFTKETFDAVSTDKYKFQDLYLTNPDGSHKRDAKGNLVYSTLAATLEQEGRFPPKVRETLNHIMSDPRVQKQLQISGKYNYKNYDAEALGKKVIAVKDDKYKNYANSLLELNLKKTSGQNVDEAISALEDNMKKSDEQYLELFNNINKNPDAVRGYLYSDEVRNQYTTMYSKMSESRTFDENPAVRFEFDMQKERNNLLAQADERRYRYAVLAQTKDEGEKNRANAVRIAAMKTDGKGKGIDTDNDGIADLFPGDGATAKGLPTDDINLVKDWEGKYNNAVETAGAATDELLVSAVFNDAGNKAKYNSLLKSLGGPGNEERARKMFIDIIAKDAKEDGAEFRARWSIKAQDYLNKNPQKLNPSVKELINSSNNAQQYYKTQRDVYNKVNADVQNDLIKNLKPINYQLGNTTLKLSPQDQHDIAMSAAGFNPFANSAIKEKAKIAQGRLNSRGISNTMVARMAAESNNLNVLPKPKTITGSDATFLGQDIDLIGLNAAVNIGGKVMDAFGQAVFGATGRDVAKVKQPSSPEMGAFNNLFAHVTNQKNIDVLKKQSDIIQKYAKLNPPLTTSLLTGDTDTDKAIREKVKNIITQYAGSGMNESPGLEDNLSSMMTVLGDPEKGSMALDATKNNVTGQVTPTIRFNDEEGNSIGEVTISLDEAAALGKTPGSWFKTKKMENAQTRLELTGNGTTAETGDLESKRTYRINDVLYNKTDFKQLKLPESIDVKANIGTQQVVDENGNRYTSYFNYLYINDNGNDFVKVLGVSKRSMDESIQALDVLNNQMIHQAIVENKSKK